jgi:ACS family hexuronate transporter-like MFS transporter
MPAFVPLRSSWRWLVCGLLLLATMINYMDRLTLNLLAEHISKELDLNNAQYGTIEAGFALAFAGGAIVFGFLVDRFNVFWVYPLAVLGWSLAGFCTGFATDFTSLLFFRILLGFAEAANWPCALKTTQHILEPGERPMGNSILQSGAALGAVLIPLVMLVLFVESRPETWRTPFFVVGAAGALWVVLWWGLLRPTDLHVDHSHEAHPGQAPGSAPISGLVIRRFLALIVLVVTINMTWHFIRAWGPKFLQSQHQFTQVQTNWFFTAYYIITDIGALSAGFVTLRLAQGGMPVHTSRVLVFFFCAALTLLLLIVPMQSNPMVLVALLLIVGFGALGVFPNYYSFSQDLTKRHQGKLTGVLSCLCWIAMAAWQQSIGWIVEGTHSYTLAFLISGLAPLIGLAALLLLWGSTREPVVHTADVEGDVDAARLSSTPAAKATEATA